jgi:hypothetical protein
MWSEIDTDHMFPQFFSPYPIESAEMLGSTVAGIVGTWGRERGLTFYEVERAGHELPRYDSTGSKAKKALTTRY